MSFQQDRIEKLKKKLYSRNAEIPVDDRTPIETSINQEEQNAWGNTDFHIDEPIEQNKSSFVKKFLVVSGIFFVISLCIALYMFVFSGGILSSENVDIKIAGPSSISSGEEVNLVLSILNENKAPLESVILNIEYPSGVKNTIDDKDIESSKEDLGGIKNGSFISKDINFVIFGNKDTIKTFNIKIQYRIKGSNAVFVKEKKHEILLSSSPVILNISHSKEINAGQSTKFDISVISNSPNLLTGLYLKADYPYGFVFEDSSLKPSSDKNEWFLGDIKNGDKREFNFTGKVSGQNEEERTFRFILGTKSDELSDIDIVLSEDIKTVVIKKPFIDLILGLSTLKDKGDYFVLSRNTNINPEINFSNTLSNQLSNLKVEATVNSSYLDKSSVSASSGGFYNSISNIISWDKNTTSSLAQLSPSESSQLYFGFNLINIKNTTKNPTANIKVKVSGLRSSSDGDSDVVVSEVSNQVRLESLMTLSAKTLYFGDIANIGPVPPKAEKTTSYTIEWSISNTHNDLKNVSVSTVLPVGVVYTGLVYPATENISYNQEDRSLVWNTSTVSYGSGFIFSPRKVSFQVKVTPSLNQVGQSLNLTNSSVAKGVDTFTDTELVSEIPPQTTKIYNSTDLGQVVR